MARDAASGAVFMAGAGLYAVLQRSGAVDFNVTPLSVGIIAIVAGLASTRRRAIATGLVLAGWGMAVLLVASGAVPTRAGDAGLHAGDRGGTVRRRRPRAESPAGRVLTSGAIAAALGRWPAWALSLVAVAGWELFWGVGPRSRRDGAAEP